MAYKIEIEKLANKKKENAQVIGALLALGIAWGVLIDILGITF